MADNRTLVRPPFDENGNVVWTDEEKPTKKKALRWWVWLIPIGLACVVWFGVFLYHAANRKTPEELCRDALKDLVADAFGSKEPMAKAMRLKDLSGILKDEPTDVNLALQMGKTNMVIGNLGLGSSEGIKLSDYTGTGFAVYTTYDRGEVSFDLRGSVSALNISMLEGHVKDGVLRLASPKLVSKVLTVPVKEIPAKWMDVPAWNMVDKDTREAIFGKLGEGSGMATEVLGIVKNGFSAIRASSADGESVLERFADTVSFTQLRDADGKERTELVVVGSEKLPCYVLRLDVDEKQFYELAELVVGAFGGERAKNMLLNAWKLKPQPDGGNGLEMLAYVTKKGDLAQLTVHVLGVLQDKDTEINATLRCMGSDNPQDKLYLTAEADVGGEKYLLDAKKTVISSRSRISSQWDILLTMPGREPIGLNASISYNVTGALLDVTVNTVYRGDTVGTMALSGELNYKNGWHLKLPRIQIEDRFTGAEMTLSGNLDVQHSKDGISVPSGTEIPILTLTEEEAQAIIDEAVTKFKWYYDHFFG